MYERLLEPDCNSVPNCTCGHEMRLVRTERRSQDAAVKQFECSACGRAVHLMVWPEAVLALLPPEQLMR